MSLGAGQERGGAAEFTLEAVEQALQQLYYNPDMAQKNVAQKWLTQAQASSQAWHFCWALLSPDKVPEIQFFGASTLHAKISRDWSDLPAEQHESLRSQLVAQVGHFADGPKMVLTRLCIALASLILHTLLGSWPTAVPDLLQAFHVREVATEADSQCLALLDVLAVLPEELLVQRLATESRAQLRSTLAREWSLLCPLLRQLLQRRGSAIQAKERALRCLASWLALDVDLGEGEGVLQDSFALVEEAELFDTAIETLVTALSQPESHRFGGSLLKMIPLVLGLQERLKRAVQDRDMETSHGICRVAVALGETHCRTFLENINHWQGFQALVNMVLFCTGIHGHYPVDETSSTLTLTFWYTLQDDIMTLDTEKQTFYLQLYRPVYMRLVDVLLHKACFPTDHDYASWSADDKEQFRTYRVDISDTLMYVYELLGPDLLRNLYDKLGMLLTNTSHPSSWQDIEALLFGFQSIAETVDVSYSDVIPGLIGLIPLITASSVQLAETIMLTIGSLAEWLADHPVMIPGVLRVVLRALPDPDLSVATISALKRICRECRYHLRPHAGDVLVASQEVLVKQIHKSTQSMWLMQALGFLLSALPDDEILGKVLALLSPHIQQLEMLANETPCPPIKSSIAHILGLLSSLVSTLDLNKQGDGPEGMRTGRPSPHTSPVVVVLQQFFPLIQTILSKWHKDSEVVEAACAVFDKSLKTLVHEFAPLVAQLCELIGQLFSAYPQASALDLTCQMVQIFVCEKEHCPQIAALLKLITNITMALFHHGARDHPDVVDSFMQLHTQVLKRKADLYLSEDLDIKVAFYCGILAFKFPEAPTVKSTCLLFLVSSELPLVKAHQKPFSGWYYKKPVQEKRVGLLKRFLQCIANQLTELISHGEDLPGVREVLEEDGTLLLQTLMEAIGGQAPHILLDYLAEVLYSISRHCPSLLGAPLRETLQPPSFPSALLTLEQKERFCQQVLREQGTKLKMRDVIKEFALLCRGQQGTEFA